MKTKAQKIKDVETGSSLVGGAKSIVFVDFSKTPTKDITVLKNSLDAISGKYRVIKKRLLGIVFKQKDVQVDTKQFGSQLAGIYSKKEISEPAGIVFKFIKDHGKDFAFKMVGGYDLATNIFFNEADIKAIGQLPSREILLAQLLEMLNAPTKSLVYTLDQIAKSKASAN